MTTHDHPESTVSSSLAATTSVAERRFTRLIAGAFLLLHFVTGPLWGWNSSSYPSVPFFPELLRGMAAYSLVFVCPMLVVWVALLCKPGVRWLWWCVAVPLALLITLDQHRLQPWAYQTLLYSVLLGTLHWERSRKWILALTISIYFYSSIGKFDFQFVHTVGREMIAAILSSVGDFSPATLTRVAFALPLGELSIAILLMVPRTRRLGGCLAIAMHVTLIILLGPWCMNHSLGVLTWNGMLAAQAWLIFIQREPSRPRETKRSDPPHRPVIFAYAIQGLLLIALVAPLGERYRWWDHWTSWALYSPHNSRAEIELHQSVARKLPDGARQFLAVDDNADGWSTLDFGAWSLAQRGVPIYPQARYQIGIAYELALAYELGSGIRATRKSASDRWTGERSEKRAIGIDEVRALR